MGEQASWAFAVVLDESGVTRRVGRTFGLITGPLGHKPEV